MKNLKDRKAICWDFDGVIIDSMPIREIGFREVLSNYPKAEVDKLIDYHTKNAGLSRYVKFEYFFKNIRLESNTETKEAELAKQFSDIMKKMLINKDLLIIEVINFIKKNLQIKMHIVSGSDGEELNYLCEKLGIKFLFKSIEGSPTPKIDLVRGLMNNFNYNKNEVCLIGDSINDYQAAFENDIDFMGYNNEELKILNKNYIVSFNEID
ncbi:HAD family hydrolase [Gillisia sp. JM1]|uniref:HAD family hydrolase n=1 Tax=Gillisia sp. JM1 TaxID=1283286 RepID=UPI0003F5C981|nr:HAD hydrolase-like protein [Gillisia sp. JM1]